MRAQHLDEYTQIETIVGLGHSMKDIGPVEPLMQGMDVGEVARLGSPEQGERLADGKFVRSERGTGDRDGRRI